MRPEAGSAPVAAAQTERYDESFEAALSVLQRISKLEKQAAIADYPVSNGNALHDLPLAILARAQFHVASAKLVCAFCDINERLIIVITQNRSVRDGEDI